MRREQQRSGSNPTVKKTGGLRPLVLILTASAMLSGCAYMPWVAGPYSWQTGGEGKWASAVGQVPQEPEEIQEPREPQEVQEAPVEPVPENQLDPRDAERKIVADIQARLADLGYQPGPIDGVAGPATISAIRHYQEDAGLRVDGKISENFVARLWQPAPVRSKIARSETPQTADPEIARTADPETPQTAEPEPPQTADPETPQTAEPEPPQTADPETLVVGYLRGEIMPDYAAGDTYAWSDGAIEQVLRTRGDTIWWSRNGDAQYSTQRSFIMPMLQWKTRAGSGRTAVGMDAAGAWPAADGKVLSFTVHESDGDNDTSALAQKWTCRRTGRGTTTVPAGTFGTVTFACERTGAAPGSWRKRVWHYAPAVRHYVRRDEFIGASREARSVDLVAVRLGAKGWPPAARGGLDQAIQKSLEEKALGEQTRWNSTAVDDTFVIQPTGELKRYGWDRCRTYVVERMTPDSPRAWPGLACRNSRSNRWIVPVLDEQNGPLATAPIN